MREKIAHLENSIHEYTNFWDSNYDIRSLFEFMNEFLANQDSKSHISEKWVEENSKLGVQSHHPFLNQIKPADKGKVNDAMKLLKNYNTQLSGQVEEMEGKVKALEQQIKKAYSTKEMSKVNYDLHSICVHDGNANSGHYYSFIYDRFQKKWRKFNDIRVTEVSEEDVFKESQGGDTWQTAYWLVYVHSTISDDLKK